MSNKNDTALLITSRFLTAQSTSCQNRHTPQFFSSPHPARTGRLSTGPPPFHTACLFCPPHEQDPVYHCLTHLHFHPAWLPGAARLCIVQPTPVIRNKTVSAEQISIKRKVLHTLQIWYPCRILFCYDIFNLSAYPPPLQSTFC